MTTLRLPRYAIMVRVTLSMYSVVEITELLVHIIIRKEYKLKELKVCAAFDTPYTEYSFLHIIPIKT